MDMWKAIIYISWHLLYRFVYIYYRSLYICIYIKVNYLFKVSAEVVFRSGGGGWR